MSAKTEITNRADYRQFIESGMNSHMAKNIIRWRKNFRPQITQKPRPVTNEYRGMSYGPELTDAQKWADAMADGAVLVNGSVHWPLRDNVNGFYDGVEVILDTGKRFVMPTKTQKVELAS